MPFQKVDGTIKTFLQADSLQTYDYNLSYTPNGTAAYKLALQAVCEDQTPGNETFIDGTLADGSVTITDYTLMTEETAVASGPITFGTPNPGDTVQVFNGTTHIFTCVAATPGADEFVDIDDLTNLIDALTGLSATNDTTDITITVDTAGTVPNGWEVNGTGIYNTLSITFSGGQDHATVTIAGHTLTEGMDFNAMTSNNVTADNVAAAIDMLSEVQAANPPGVVITVLAATIGLAGNSITTTKTGNGITVQQAHLTQGLDSDVDGTEHTINLPDHGMTTGLKVHYTVDAGTTLDNLTTNTDYYVIVVDPDTIKLAATLVDAENGDAIEIADADDSVGGGEFSLLATALSVVIKLQASNDGTHFSDISGRTHTFTGDGSVLWDLGTPFFKFLRTVITPATGEVDVTLIFNAINLS